MKTLKIFLVFCRLKCEEVWDGFKDWIKDNFNIIILIFMALVYFGIIVYAKVTNNRTLEVIFLIPVFLFFGVVVFMVSYCLISWLIQICKSNWQKATKIVEEDE